MRRRPSSIASLMAVSIPARVIGLCNLTTSALPCAAAFLAARSSGVPFFERRGRLAAIRRDLLRGNCTISAMAFSLCSGGKPPQAKAGSRADSC